jgi:hypothetical protein
MADVSARKFPSFLGIGAPRAGTTWLYINLRRHPEIWLPPLRELHYFDCERPGAAAAFPLQYESIRRSGWKWYVRHSFYLLRYVWRLRSFLWGLRYMLGLRSDRWYVNLFRKDRVSGEITPEYMLLPKNVVEEIHALNPDMKIILLLRDPVTRAWMDTRREMARVPPFASNEEILKIIDAPHVVMSGDYAKAIEVWRGVFGAKQVFIGFYDDMVAAPRELLRSILDFLGVASDDEFIPKSVAKLGDGGARKQNQPPLNFLPHMYATYIEQLRALEKLLGGGHAATWRATAEKVIATRR